MGLMTGKESVLTPPRDTDSASASAYAISEFSDSEIAARMDRAIRRSLQMPPKPLKETRRPRPHKRAKAAAKPETPSE
jgi:hypothetical protein